MVKLKKGNTLIFGLTEENIKRLQKDQPIKFNLQELGMDDVNVYIIAGKDEQAFYQMFKDKIDPIKTIITDSRHPNN